MEPSRIEVLAWMERTGEGAATAATHFWPRAGVDDLDRLKARIRKWRQRAEPSLPMPPRAPPPTRPTAAVAPDYTATELGEEAFYERMVAGMQGAVDLAMRDGDLKELPSLNKELRAAREALDAARGPGRRIKLDRSAPAVAARLRVLSPLLARLEERLGLTDVIEADEE